MAKDLTKLTEDGLPIVAGDIFLKVVQDYPIASGTNSDEVRKRIEKENPQIARIIKLGMEGDHSREAKVYYEMGCQITYELLREQSRISL